MGRRWARRALTALAALAVALPGTLAAADPGASPVPPVRRVACPSVEAVATASGYLLDTLTSTLTACWYEGSPQPGAGAPTHRVEFTYTKDYSLDAARARIGGWSVTPGTVAVTDVEGLSPGAFAWSDSGPVNLYWEVSPGAVGTLSGVSDQKAAVAVAALFQPQMKVYTVPGEHEVGGRRWRTTCENYSHTVRCATEIWGTSVVRRGDEFVRQSGWGLNSLTYRWSDRDLWQGNLLTTPGTWTTPDGRRWRTECDSASTGRGACRTYLHSTTVEAVTGPDGTVSYREVPAWVLNNQVLFS